MPNTVWVEHMPCPTPGCDGSRSDTVERDENGCVIRRITSAPCPKCGK